jgi:hypothetical protein
LPGVAGTGPKATLQNVLNLCSSGQIAKPARIYLRSNMTHFCTSYSQLNMGGSNTTITPEKVEFLNYPGEEPTIDTWTAGHPSESSSGYGPIHVRSRNWRFKGLILRGAYVLYFGGTGTSGGPCMGSSVYRCRQTETLNANGGFIDNHGVVTGGDANCADLTVEQCHLLGSVVNNANYGTLSWSVPGDNILVTDCRVSCNSALGNCTHHKYGSAHPLDGFLYRRNVLAHAIQGGRLFKNSDGQSHVTFRHNIWWSQDLSAFFNTSGVTGSTGDRNLAYRIRLFNNGMYRNTGWGSTNFGIWIVDNLQNANQGRELNFYDNELMGRLRFSTSADAQYTELAMCDRNVYQGGNANTHMRGPTSSAMTLAAWKSYQSYMGAGFDDANSVEGLVTFLNPGTQDPNDPRTFLRHSSSPLYPNAGPDISQFQRWAGAGEGAW